ncbi:hypothetical protein BDQ17DRAFT_1393908 [Cyathus striatus]|nr:hypothetical protein BDQ17DRAFT_1393908 [Cyathus striatus]
MGGLASCINRQVIPHDDAPAPHEEQNHYFTAPQFYCVETLCAPCGAVIAWTKFIVDSYHYINHRTTDYTCHKWCNPAPLNGSAPNLVVACEQLNAWLGGFQSILNRMTVVNFNWTIHALLFIHTQKVIKKQLERDNNTKMIKI